MPWNQADADAVRAAITKLATGTRVVTVLYAGPPERTVTYQMVQLPELRALLAEMERTASGAPTYRLGATRKGLGGGRGGFGSGWGCP